MDRPITADAVSRFEAYVEGLVSVIRHADRARPLRDCCVGRMTPCERKSVEPMAVIGAACADGLQIADIQSKKIDQRQGGECLPPLKDY